MLFPPAAHNRFFGDRSWKYVMQIQLLLSECHTVDFIMMLSFNISQVLLLVLLIPMLSRSFFFKSLGVFVCLFVSRLPFCRVANNFSQICRKNVCIGSRILSIYVAWAISQLATWLTKSIVSSFCKVCTCLMKPELALFTSQITCYSKVTSRSLVYDLSDHDEMWVVNQILDKVYDYANGNVLRTNRLKS